MPPGADAALQWAETLYAAGRFDEAETALKQILSERPCDIATLLLLGSIAGRADKLAEAAALFERVREIDPRRIEALKGLGLVYRRQGRLADAIAAYRRALRLDGKDAETHVNLAVALKAAGDLPGAIRHLQQALAREPRLSAAYRNLGNCYFDQGDLDRAGAAYLECIKLSPRDAPAVLGLAKVFREQNRVDMAEKTLTGAAKLMAGNVDIQAALGALMQEMGRVEEAQAVLDAALRIDPRHHTALYNMGNLHRQEGRWDEAERYYRLALDVAPDDPSTLTNLAATFEFAGQPAAAVAVLERALQAHPDRPDIRYSHGLALLSDGNLREGWLGYGWRPQKLGKRATRFPHLPRLEAPVFTGRKVVIWVDQGIGDHIIYGSFLQDLRGEASRIVCELDARLVPLFSRGFPEFTFVEQTFDAKLPPIATDDEALRVWGSAKLDPRFAGATHQIALADLGRWVRLDFASFPQHSGYLRADPARVAEYRERLNRRPDERVIGVSWRSNNPTIGRHKSIGLKDIVACLPSAGTRLMSLQYGEIGEEIAAVERATSRRVEAIADLDYFNDIEGLAALVMACDAVVTVSNVTAHIAGSLGQRTALLCPAAQGKLWYWFRRGDRSPWYPSLRVFRQEGDGSWATALSGCAEWCREA